jgi:hypothetical protein
MGKTALAAAPESKAWKHGVGETAEAHDAAGAAAAGEVSGERGEQSEDRYGGDGDQS